MKAELKQFRKIRLKLTPKQQEALAPFSDEVNGGYVGSDGEDHRFAVLGNVWLAGIGVGTVDCFLLPADAYRTVNRAILRARKNLKD